MIQTAFTNVSPTTDFVAATEADAAAIGALGAGLAGSGKPLVITVHDGQADRRGFIPGLVSLARERGASACIGDGANRWTGVHRLDAARLFRRALEGIRFTAIAGAIGAGLGLPVTSVGAEEAEAHFGYLAAFVGLDNLSSNARTRALLGWKPEQPGLLADIEHGG